MDAHILALETSSNLCELTLLSRTQAGISLVELSHEGSGDHAERLLPMAEQLLEHLSVSLGQLSARQQRIFILSRLHGCSYQEIADQLNVSLSTVQKELKLIMAICVGVAERLDRP